MVYNIFISYSEKDAVIANSFENHFKQIKDCSIFMFKSNLVIGDLAAGIRQHIQQSDLFIVLISKNSLDSNYVQQEIGAAKALNKIIVPIVLESDVEPSAMLQGYRYLKYYHGIDWQKEANQLSNYIYAESQKKSNRQALLAFGVLLGLGYLLSKDN